MNSFQQSSSVYIFLIFALKGLLTGKYFLNEQKKCFI